MIQPMSRSTVLGDHKGSADVRAGEDLVGALAHGSAISHSK